ncbi:uncharacterized protein EDB93DRAFT_1181997, partial [Suillus bovinus]|uniref:uncharacterized protein n=1 Tax=Suillus bovinus TaxID=48563 RepID=UPI001B86DFFD
MIIRPAYETLFHEISTNERNIVVHGSAGIDILLLFALVRRLLARQPVTYQIDQSDSSVLCFTANGFFALPEENSEYHPLFDPTQEDSVTHSNTDHTRALMRGIRSKAIFTTFWPDSLGHDIGWLSEYDVALRKWMKPCTFDEIFAMSTLTLDQHKAKSLRWSYIHFGIRPALRESEARYSRNLFAVEPGNACADPLSFPISQVVTRLFAGEITSVDSAGAKETADVLLNSEDTKEAGEIFYRHAVVALMSRSGGTFTLGRPDLRGHYHPAHEELVLQQNTHMTNEEQRAMHPNFIYSTRRELATLAEYCPQLLHTPQHALVHPGIDAVMFDASSMSVWLVQVTHGSPRPVSPEGLLFLLDVVRKTPYEPSPTHPWKFVYAIRGQPTNIFFRLSGKERTQHFSMNFWMPRIKPYVMQLRDTHLNVHPSGNPYEQWGFLTNLLRHLANSMTHLVPKCRCTTKSGTTQDTFTSDINGTIIQESGVPGAQLLGEIVKEQDPGPVDHYLRDNEETNSWRGRFAK